MSTTTTDPEMNAIQADAAQRLEELRKVRAILWPDRDDAEVLSELIAVQGQIRQAESALEDAER